MTSGSAPFSPAAVFPSFLGKLSSLTIPEKEGECKFLPLAGRAKLRKHELLCKSNDPASFLPHAWLWTTQSKHPFRVRDLPQVQLRTAKMCLQAARILHS